MEINSNTAQQINPIIKTVSTPDPFRLKYHKQIVPLVTAIISIGADRVRAMALINDNKLHVPSEDQDQFVYAVEKTLMALHEGNFARFFVSFTEFKKWKEAWDI